VKQQGYQDMGEGNRCRDKVISISRSNRQEGASISKAKCPTSDSKSDASDWQAGRSSGANRGRLENTTYARCVEIARSTTGGCLKIR